MKEYTTLRRIYAWVGFAAIIFAITATALWVEKVIIKEDICEPTMSTILGPAYVDPKTGRITICG